MTESPSYEELMKEEPAREFVMPFGKHEGETLEEIYLEDRGYFDWCLCNLTNEDVVIKMEDVESQMENVRVY